MIRWKNLKIRTKLLLFFMLVGIIPLIVITMSISLNLKRDLTHAAFEKLKIVQTERLNFIESMFADIQRDVSLLVKNKSIIKVIDSLTDYSKDSGALSYGRFPTHTETYNKIAGKYDEYLREIMIKSEGSDLILISYKTGQVIYTVNKKSDLGTNLENGPLKKSGLGSLWSQMKENNSATYIDFVKYPPADNRHCAFIGQTIYDNKGKPKGILCIQLTASAISKIVQSRKNMGNTGESYLISYIENQDIYEIRSNIKTLGDGKYVIGYRHHNNLDYWLDARKSGKKGGYGIYSDSVENDVLVAFNQIDIKNINWYLISKIDKDEVFLPIKRLFYFVFAVLTIVITATVAGSIFFSRTMASPILKVINFAESVSKGDLKAKLGIRRKDELGKLTEVLNSMARNLHRDQWIKSGKEGLDDVMRGEHSINDLASKFISFIVPYLDGALGAVYQAKDEKSLSLIASYAFSDREDNFNKIDLGEGLVGQAALEQKIIYFTDVNKDVPFLNTGIDKKKPVAIMAAPLVFEGELIGAFLVGSMEPFQKKQKEFTKLCIDNITVLFKAAISRQTITRLLASSRQQQEELEIANRGLEEQAKVLKKSQEDLQSQQEELRVTNEELEEQTKALKESESELQAQQEELKVTNQELEERTRALEEQSESIRDKNTRLSKIREDVEKKAIELETANRYKSQFLANMSHELRTPLNSILILARILTKNKDSNLTAKQVESASAIYSSGADLLRIINEILDLSKVEAGKLDLYFENVTIPGLCSDLERIFHDQAKEKNIDFSIEKKDDVPIEIHTDSHRLQQILRNLLSNSFKFTENGKVTVTLERPEKDELTGTGLLPEKSTAFRVIDNGIGIPQEKLSGIFEAFQQVDGSISRKYGGTGLGLSISRALTSALGGIIRVESKEGKGSTFTIILPDHFSPDNRDLDEIINENLHQKKKETDQPAQQPDNSSREESISEPEIENLPKSSKTEVKDDRNIILPGDKTILLIEDDETFLGVLADIARESGFKCIVAETGEKGLLYAETYKPSAIILDVSLPGIDGWTVMERLKSNSDLRHIPVHFISGNDAIIDAMKMGAIGYLVKPVTIEKMAKAFDKIESTISSKIKNLLVVEDDEIQQKSIAELIGNNDVQITIAPTGQKAFKEINEKQYDCIVLDLGLSDMSGFSLLEKIKNSTPRSAIPVIIYTGRDLTRSEEEKLNKYTESIIIKGVKSPERLLDETALFLHRVESKLPPEKRQMLKMIHNREEVLKGKNVLLVDDDMRNVFALSSILEEHLINVSVARDGLESIRQLEEKPDTDLILMDIMMPKMDGYQAIKKIREKQKFSKLPIIALTAKAMKGDRAKCIEAGASDYLAKPVNVEKLISMLRVWLYR